MTAAKLVQKQLRVPVGKKYFTVLLLLLSLIPGYRYFLVRGEVNVLRLGLNLDLNKTPIDPADINNLSKAIISDNIYGRLISYDDGVLQPWLADSFSVEGNKIVILISEARTSSGKPITAKDVKFSLERLIKKDTNTHAKLQRFLDFDLSNGAIKVVSETKIEISLKKAKFVKTFLRVLSSSEYGIVPESAVNSKLEIVDYKETTGAFFIEGNILHKNKFFKAEHDYASQVHIVTSPSSADLTQLFIEDKVDVLPTTVNLNQQILEERLNGYQYNLFKTDKIKLFLTAFGPNAISNFSPEERGILIEKVQQGLLKSYPLATETEVTSSFFPTIVSAEVAPSSVSNSIRVGKVLNFVSYTGLEKAMAGLTEEKSIKVTYTDDFPLEVSFENRPDSFFMMCDVAFDDDFTLYSYVLNNKIIPVTDSEKENLLDNVLEIDDLSQKREELNKFHNKIIRERLVGPLFRAPYTILTRKPYSSHQTTLSASTKLWQIY